MVVVTVSSGQPLPEQPTSHNKSHDGSQAPPALSAQNGKQPRGNPSDGDGRHSNQTEYQHDCRTVQ